MKSLMLSLAMVAAAITLQAKDTSPVGVWDWKFDNPEQGMMIGKMTITSEGEAYKCVMTGPEGDIEMEGLKIEDQKMIAGHIMYNGMKVEFKGTFSGDNFEGKLIVDYNEFPFDAFRAPE